MSNITAPLVAFAYLAETAHESGHNLDLISALVPLLGIVSSAHDGHPFQATVLARELRTRFGLRVNPYAVEQWIPQLKASGVIKATVVVAPKGLKPVEQLFFSKVGDSIDLVDESDIDHVVKQFLIFSKPRLERVGQHMSDQALEEAFLREIADLDFLAAVFKTNKSVKSTRLSLASNQASNHENADLTAASEIDVLCATFFLHMAEEDPEAFDLIVKIASGAVISEVLFDVGNPQTITSFVGQTILLDGPICIKALGLNSKEDETHTTDLLNSLSNRGAKFAIFEHTVNEVKSLLSAALKGSTEPWGYGPTVRRIRSDRTAEVLARSVLADVELAVRAIGLKDVLKNPTTSAAWALLPQMREDALSEKLAWYENPESRQRDAASLAATYRLRAGLRTNPKQIHDSRFLFVTENARLVDVSYGFFHGDPDAPIAVTDRYLAGYLFVMCGGSDDITGLLKRRVLANCTNAVAPRTDLIEKMASFVDELDENHRRRYTAMMTDSRAARYLTEITFGNSGYLQAHNFENVLAEIYDEVFVEKSKALTDQKITLEAESSAKMASIEAEHSQKLAAERENQKRLQKEMAAKDWQISSEQTSKLGLEVQLSDAKSQLRAALEKAAKASSDFGLIVNFLLYLAYALLSGILAWVGDVISQSSDSRIFFYLLSALLMLVALHRLPQYLIDRPRIWFVQWQFRRLLANRGLTSTGEAFNFDPVSGALTYTSPNLQIQG